MVNHFYTPSVTDYSETELQRVFEIVEPPVTLLGGWAVHLNVVERFQADEGRPYIGSRDIDIGVHVDPKWSHTDIADKPVGQLLERIETQLDYNRSRFGFLKQVDHETGEPLTESEAASRPMHELFSIYIDVIPDTPELDIFEEVFGFRPPDDPLLTEAFNGKATPLNDHVSWDVDTSVTVVDAEVLAAMKVRSLPERDKSHKQVKDVADLFALLWYTGPHQEMVAKVSTLITDENRAACSSVISDGLYEQSSALTGVQKEIIQNAISNLIS